VHGVLRQLLNLLLKSPVVILQLVTVLSLCIPLGLEVLLFTQGSVVVPLRLFTCTLAHIKISEQLAEFLLEDSEKVGPVPHAVEVQPSSIVDKLTENFLHGFLRRR
jgi:hypothetical protein